MSYSFYDILYFTDGFTLRGKVNGIKRGESGIFSEYVDKRIFDYQVYQHFLKEFRVFPRFLAAQKGMKKHKMKQLIAFIDNKKENPKSILFRIKDKKDRRGNFEYWEVEE